MRALGRSFRIVDRIPCGGRHGLLALLLLLLPAGALAQERPESGADQETPKSGTEQEMPPAEADQESAEPEMAKAPLQFRLSGTVGAFFWGRKQHFKIVLSWFTIDGDSGETVFIQFTLFVFKD